MTKLQEFMEEYCIDGLHSSTYNQMEKDLNALLKAEAEKAWSEGKRSGGCAVFGIRIEGLFESFDDYWDQNQEK